MASAAGPVASATAARHPALAALQRFLVWHRGKLIESPYRTNAIQGLVLMFAGDRIAQRFEQEGSGVRYTSKESWVRTGVVCCWAAGPSSAFWTAFYTFLARRFPGPPAGSPLLLRLRGAVPSVVASASLSPAVNSAFMAWTTSLEHVALYPGGPRRALGTAEGREGMLAKVRHKIRTQLIPTVIKSTSIWAPFNLVNLSLTPLHYRMLTGGSVALLWNIALSVIQHSDHAHGHGHTQPHALVQGQHVQGLAVAAAEAAAAGGGDPAADAAASGEGGDPSELAADEGPVARVGAAAAHSGACPAGGSSAAAGHLTAEGLSVPASQHKGAAASAYAAQQALGAVAAAAAVPLHAPGRPAGAEAALQ